jgi:hypothetical protein
VRRRVLAVLAAAAASLALLEIAVFSAGKAGLLHTAAPRYGAEGFWVGGHPEFGVWHRPGARTRHHTACFDVVYAANSVGTRDVERELRSDAPRVVVLGDSFFEGWGVSDAERLSNRLEAATGVEHLNFAMAHFGPYQELLVYRALASRFDHHAVLVGVTPENDFADVDIELAAGMRGYDYRYRPYLVGEPPALQPFEWREGALRRRLRRVSWAFNAGLAAWEAWRPLPPGPRSGSLAEAARHSFYYEVEARPLRLLEEILGRLADAAAGRPVAVVLVPTARDVARHAEAGAAPLTARLEALGAVRGFQVVDLLPVFARAASRESLFHACDYHWGRSGHGLAARHVREALGPRFWERPPPRDAPALREQPPDRER